jgi:outer membrane protein assembly factor BamE (lipoprotein component of BamABCDE complex)
MRIAAALLAASVILAGCAPVITTRGYLPDPDVVSSIDVGKDTKTSVQKRLGDPSTQATFNEDGWYYISSTEKTVAFFTPTILKRSILAVYFDKDGKVTDLKH